MRSLSAGLQHLSPPIGQSGGRADSWSRTLAACWRGLARV